MKITQSQFKKFKERCDYWMDRFGLHQWERYYRMKKFDDKLIKAEAEGDMNTMVAAIYMNSEWPIEPTEMGIDDAACHEVIHILLAELSSMAAFFYSSNRTGEAQHRIINHLMKALSK